MMIILEHPITADVVLVTASNAEYLAFIGNKSPAEFRDDKFIIESNLLTCVFVDIIEVDILGTPLEVVDKLS